MECLNVDAAFLRTPLLPQRRTVKRSTSALCVASTATVNRSNLLEHQMVEKPQVICKNNLPLGAQLSTFFHHTPTKDAHAWTEMMTSCNEHGDFVNAIELFYMMLTDGIKAEKESFVAALGAAAGLRDLAEGKRIHALIQQIGGLEKDISVASALITMYGKTGVLGEACNAFEKIPAPDSVAWDAVIGAYCENGTYANVMDLIEIMTHDRVQPTEANYITILNNCQLRPEHARTISIRIAASAMYSNIPLGVALINTFAKLGDLEQAREVFTRIPNKNAVPYAALITAYLNKNLSTEALRYFRQMQERNVQVDVHTCAAALYASALYSDIEQGRAIHQMAVHYGFSRDPKVQSSLISMYAKCGSDEDARAVFEEMEPWNRGTEAYCAMIGVYGRQKKSDLALKFAWQMGQEGVEMNEESFFNIITACVGIVHLTEMAYSYFHAMVFDYGITASEKHYNVMMECVRQCGSSGITEVMEALKTAKEKVAKPPEIRGAEETRMLKELLGYRPVNGRREGRSNITINNVCHSFTAGDKSHPYTKEIYKEVDRIHELIKKEGYVADTKYVLHNVTERQKQNLLKAHSERLAIAYGNLVTEPGSTLRIIKNLRVCVDCHNACKLLAKVLGRELVMRDNKRFHHVAIDGTCSCNDYW